MAGKGNSIIVRMRSTATKADGSETGYEKTTTINKKNRQMKGHTGKFTKKMHDPVANKHVPFVAKEKLK